MINTFLSAYSTGCAYIFLDNLF